MVVQDQTEMFSILSHHPVCGVKVAGATFSYCRSHPSWPGGAIRPNAFQQLALELLTQDTALIKDQAEENTRQQEKHDEPDHSDHGRSNNPSP